VFVPEVEGVGWLPMFRLALRTQVGWWGGQGNLVLPLPNPEEAAEHELLWQLLEVFDADTYLLQQVTTGDLRDLAPEMHRDLQTRRESELRAAGFSETASHLDDFDAEPLDVGELGEGFRKLLIQRLAPLNFDGHPMPSFGRAADHPEDPFTAVHMLHPLPSRVRALHADLPPEKRLLVGATIGELTAWLRERLPDTVHVNDVDGSEAQAWREATHGFGGTPGPWVLANAGLAGYRRVTARGLAAPVLVVGDDAWDFALFYALRVLRGAAFWLPTGSLDEPLELLAMESSLRQAARLRNASVSVAQWSSPDARDAAIAALRTTYQDLRLEKVRWQELVPDYPLRLFERDRLGVYEPLTTYRGLSGPVNTPVPRNVGSALSTELSWMVDVDVQGWSAIRHPALGPFFVRAGAYDTWATRAGRDGLAYVAPNQLVRSESSLESQTVRPQLATPSLLEQVRAAFEARGWRCEPSDKGIYAAASAAMFGGFAQLRRALTDARASMLTVFLTRAPEAPGGLFGGQRLLTLAELSSVAVAADPAVSQSVAEEMIVGLQEAGALQRGLALKCETCRQASFYELDEAGTEFRCRRCRTHQRVSPFSWMHGAEPLWRYGLAEVLYQFLDADGDLPVLGAADFASGEMMSASDPARPLQLTFELDVYDDAAVKSELDIVLANGSELWVGEATHRDRLEPTRAAEQARLNRLRAIAEVLGARGVLLVGGRVFAGSTRQRLESNFSSLWPRLQVVEDQRVAPRWSDSA
jgi:hypothetical protein